MRNVACHSLLHGLADRGKLVTLMGALGLILSEPEKHRTQILTTTHLRDKEEP